MSGHSRYANIKHRKGAADARRSRIFSRLSRELTTAVLLGGSPDPTDNPRLRGAIASARKENMPGDNISRAIRRAGGVGGSQLSEGTFEGFMPGGVGVFVETASDNHNRTVMRVRTHFRRHGGSLGQHGCLSAIFARLGVLTASCPDPDTLSLALIDAGAEDLHVDGEHLTVRCQPADLSALAGLVNAEGLTVSRAAVERIPTLRQPLSTAHCDGLRRILDALDVDEDVVAVYHSAALEG
ncbi:MAG: YebC/PmpR family DNA-binding regulatory protein [Myxococcota bacterium]|jgi:YebC/PmpR family DNA-binding regulatory protein